MYKIKTLNNISQEGLALLGGNYAVTTEDPSPDAILLRSFKMHDMELPESVKIIGRAGAGVNNIPIEEYAAKGVVVVNTPGANANAVKELVILGLLLSSRKVVSGINWAKSVKDDPEVEKLIEKEKSKFAGQELTGKKIGVIGLGAIGVLVANAALSMGMEVYGYDPFVSVESAWGLSCEVKRALSLDEIVLDCDYITLHVPLIDQTKNMINLERLQKAKPGLKLLNFARGALVNNEVVKEALDKGYLSCYVTDFPDQELLNMENVIGIPHLGASTAESEENCAKMAVRQLKEYLENGNIVNSVNYPDCYMGLCSTNARIGITHTNVPNMVGQITSILAKDNINIGDMLNKSKGGFAYTLLDVELHVTEDTVKRLESIEGILKVRVIKND
ncbi:phosphoglycerate dehydrogenase [Alkalibacter mobilis]|uniref:phosphoglycerate dehydrogenase n=1 Tax=Alkalibacter mobilis TaxID=2787712 RepID=UPI00189C66E1|nr:phosphoglycerate dehydrogenase [Alkalibacter mobilis]MBF7097648.1 phosphoglycerate dehydrogenase [Alkalibacter mobilis]